MDHDRSEWTSIRRVATRSGLLLLPFALLIALELFVLPLDTFTFRIWEAALASPYRYPGPFHPNLEVTKSSEFGDFYRLGDPTRVGSKPVKWYTDNFGWRNRPEVESKAKYDIVVLGDSNVVGTFLDQRDTIAEALSRRGNLTAYSYSIAHDHISLFFSDPRMVGKSPELIVVESKVVNWIANDSYLSNFRERPDGTLDVVDRSAEFKGFYDPARNRWMERLESQWSKRAMFRWLKAVLAADFQISDRGDAVRIAPVANKGHGHVLESWRPRHWVVSGGEQRVPSSMETNVLHLRSSSPNAYMHTEAFRARQPDGAIRVRFEARNSLGPSRNRFYVFEDGSYRMIGELAVTKHWQTYEIPVTTNRGSVLELQIDLPDEWQWFSIRDFQVLQAKDAVIPLGRPVPLFLTDWVPQPTSCGAAEVACGAWRRDQVGAYVQTSPLPDQGPAGLLLRFEARADVAALAYSPVYLFEGADYRQVAQYAYSTEWREHALLLRPRRGAAAKVQFDIPPSVENLFVRNVSVTPVGDSAAAQAHGKP